MPPMVGVFSSKEYDVGAGDWVTGGVRRAVSGVAGLLPSSGAAEPEAEPREQAPTEQAPTEQPPSEEPPTEHAPTESTPEGPGAQAEVRTATPPARARRAPATPRSRAAATGSPAVAEGSGQGAESVGAGSPWTDEELAGFRVALDEEIARLRAELDMGEADLADLVADSSDGAGDDQADSGSKTFEREQEMSVNANTRELIDQALRARARLDRGTYGICERCGNPIAIGRLRAAPRATLCITCKQAEERR